MHRVLLPVIALILAAGVFQTPMAADGDGGYAGSFLQVPIGARPTALGGAYLGISDDGTGLLYNPAGVATLRRALFSSSYRAMRLDRTLSHVSFLLPTRLHSVLGVSWLFASSGEVEARDSDGRALGWDLGMTHHDFSVVFAKRFETYFAAGIRMNYYYARYWEFSSSSVGFDLGAMLHVDQLVDRDAREGMAVRDIRVGLTVKNLAASYRWNSNEFVDTRYGSTNLGSEQDDDFPMEFGLGASARFLDRKLLIASDVIKNDKQDPFLHAGTEYYAVPEFAVRAGFSDGRLTAGTGYLLRFGSRMLAVDYAFSTDRADEGSEHIFSIEVIF